MMYASNNIIQNISCPKQNCKIVYCSFDNMPKHGIGVCVDTKWKYFNSFLKRGENIKNEEFLLNRQSCFFRIQSILTKLFSKR